MRGFLAIVKLTIRSAVRMRLIPAVGGALFLHLAVLPFLIEHNGTADMFTQVVLTYSLAVVTFLLGLTTIWLACGTMARDIGDAHMQVVATKPVARWQIWLGKWVGIVLLNAGMLALSGGVIAGMIHWRAKELSPEQRQALRREILVARGSVKEALPYGETDIQRRMGILRETPGWSDTNESRLRQEAISSLKRANELVAPGRVIRWDLDLSGVKDKIQDQPLHLRVRFYSSDFKPSVTNMTMQTDFEVGSPERSRQFSYDRPMAPESFHEFEIRPNLYNEDGILRVSFANHNRATVLFPLEDGLEALYPEGGFAMNFARALGVVLCWLSLLAAVGLCGASFLSFPVAAFLVFTLLMVISSGNLITEIVAEGTISGIDHETGEKSFGYLDWFLVPVFKLLLLVVEGVKSVSPIDALSSGRVISWGQFFGAFARITLLFGGLFFFLGSIIFTRRELAAAESHQ